MDFTMRHEFGICVHRSQTRLRISDFATWTLKDNGTGRDDFSTLKTLEDFETGKWTSRLELQDSDLDVDLRTRTCKDSYL